MNIPIDTRNFETTHGHAPVGRRFWNFRIVTSTNTVTFRTGAPVTYAAACDDVVKRAEALGAVSVAVVE
jgi:hypothetical protein